MQLIDEDLILSASDLTNFLACEHLLRLELEAVQGMRAHPEISLKGC